MTLDEAIKHAEEVAEEKQLKANNLKQCKDYGNPKSTITSGVSECETCADEHRQLAEWLKDYKRLLEQQPSDDICVSRASLKDIIGKLETKCNSKYGRDSIYAEALYDFVYEIKALPPVTPMQNWIPIITREPTEEEKEDYFKQNGEELCYMIDSPMPDNGQEVLVSVGDTVGEDIFDEDFWNFEGWDIDDIDAWMPMPLSYQGKECSKNESNN